MLPGGSSLLALDYHESPWDRGVAMAQVDIVVAVAVASQNSCHALLGEAMNAPQWLRGSCCCGYARLSQRIRDDAAGYVHGCQQETRREGRRPRERADVAAYDAAVAPCR